MKLIKMSVSRKKERLVSIVIPVYKPEEEVFNKTREILKRQTISVEVIEKWNNPEAVSINLGIKEAKGDFVIILAQDCVPENEKFAEEIIKPLEKPEVVAVVSDLLLPEYQWKKRPFFARMFTIADLKLRKPSMNLTSCAYRKSDLEKIGCIDENVSAIDIDFWDKIKKLGKIERGNVIVYHMHPHYDYKKVLKTFYAYSRFNGAVIRNGGTEGFSDTLRIVRGVPILGFGSIYFRYPWKKKFYLFPLHFFTAGIIEHAVNVLGFWHGLILGDDASRNKEVLSEKKSA